LNDKKPPVTSTDPITGQSLRLAFEERAAPSHADAQALLDYWNVCRQNGDFVMGRDIPARAVARLTKNLFVLEPIEAGRNFRFRLVGTVLLNRFGRDVTGAAVSEVYDAAATKDLVASLNKVLASAAPVFLDVRVHGVLGEIRYPETVLLPMTSPDGHAAWVLGGVFYR
jgi:hypothetical protein